MYSVSGLFEDGLPLAELHYVVILVFSRAGTRGVLLLEDGVAT